MRLSAKAVAPVATLLVASGVAALMISTRPSAESTRPTRKAPLVEVLELASTPARLSVNAQGSVEPRSESDLVTEVSGRIVWVSPNLAAGGFFGAGEPLLRIDPRDYEVALEGAKAALARAESELRHRGAALERQRSMRETGASSRARLDDAVLAEASAAAGLREARVAVRRAELDHERTEIRAAYAGRVREKRVGIGQFVGRGVPVARVYAIDFAEVRLPISDADLAFLDLPLGFQSGPQPSETGAPRSIASLPAAGATSGPAVTLSADYAGERRTWTGYIVRTEGALDARTRMINVVARVDDPYGRDATTHETPLPVGLFVDATISGREVPNTFALPRAAVHHGREVLVVDESDRIHVRRVDVLRSQGDTTWIRDGLAAGERIVTTPLEVATEGMKVRTRRQHIGRDSSRTERRREPVAS